jgi:hypothetical protein
MLTLGSGIMNRNVISEAKQLLDQGWALVPCAKNSKANTDKNILTKNYTIVDFKEDLNVAVNLGKSNLIDWDCDSSEACAFSEKVLKNLGGCSLMNVPIDNSTLGETTHYFFTQDQDYSKLFLERLDLNGKKMIELRHNHITIIPPSITKHKVDQKDCIRVWKNFIARPPVIKNIFKLWNLANFATFLMPVLKSANTGMLKLDGCLKRYTDFIDSERVKFLELYYSTKFKNEWGIDKDLKLSKIKRIINANNRDNTRTAGYKSFADYLKIDPLELKRALSWIGQVPDEKTESKKTIVDFFEKGLDIDAILKTEFPPIQFTVKPVMPEGLGLVSGRPKAMKSWTMLDLAYCVQNNLKWMNHEVIQGDVLYLALEDNPRRMKDRITKLGHNKCKKHPTIVTESPYLNYGLEESIRTWTQQVFHPRLVIVDTLAKVKNQWNRTDTAYDKDNKLLRDIQHLAGELSISIIFVSHLGKAQQDYSWDRIQGSTGMQGMTDFMWMLDRGDQGTFASLKGRGRDIEDFEYALSWNDKTWKYDCEGKLYEIQMQENRRDILEAMKHFAYDKKQLVVKPNEVASFLSQTSVKGKARISKTMQRMLGSRDLIKGEVYGTYKLFTSLPDVSTINFENDKMN